VAALIKWCREFHVLRPLTNVTAITTLCHRLEQHGMSIDWEKITPATLMSYSCHVYMHYGFCLECCLYGLDQKLFLGIPPTLDPRRITGKPRGGRTAKAVPGQPLTTDAAPPRKKSRKGGSRAAQRRVIDDDSDDE
jgi:hypothetical protein